MACLNESLSIIPLGGVMEIGKNMICYEYGDSIIVVDSGLMFPNQEMLGVDIVIQDITYLEENKQKIKGIFLTHGHEDHIGSLPYVLKKIKVPVYGTALTLGFVANKLEEHKILSKCELYEVTAGDIMDAGDFEIEYFQVAHSIPDTCGLVIRTPIGTAVQTADFKFDSNAVNGYTVDLARLAEIGKENIIAFLCDTTNVEKPGRTQSEKEVGDTLDKIISEAPSRVIIAAFASNIHRIQQVVDIAEKYEKKVAIVGRSMIENSRIAEMLGYLEVSESIKIPLNEIDSIPPEKLVIITTGSQGEPLSALSKMAAEEHKFIDIHKDDTVIISANPIPGNESYILKTINRLFSLGANVIYSPLENIHVSGHANQEDIKLMLNFLKPKHLIPVHGEWRHYAQFVSLAEGVGYNKEKIFGLTIGDVLKITETEAYVDGKVPCGSVLVDGLGVGDVEDLVLRDRIHLSTDGVVIVVCSIDVINKKLIGEAEIFSRGLAGDNLAENLLEPLPDMIAQKLLMLFTENTNDDIETIKSTIKRVTSKHIYEKTRRRPLVVPVITEF